MYYRHNLDYTYPERSDQHMLVLKRTHEVTLDENYAYMPHGVAFRIKRARLLKLMALPSYACTLVYNIAVAHSISVYVGLSITLSSITYSFIRDAIAAKKQKEASQNV